MSEEDYDKIPEYRASNEELTPSMYLNASPGLQNRGEALPVPYDHNMAIERDYRRQKYPLSYVFNKAKRRLTELGQPRIELQHHREPPQKEIDKEYEAEEILKDVTLNFEVEIPGAQYKITFKKNQLIIAVVRVAVINKSTPITLKNRELFWKKIDPRITKKIGEKLREAALVIVQLKNLNKFVPMTSIKELMDKKLI